MIRNDDVTIYFWSLSMVTV